MKYLITYDLDKPGQNYDSLYTAIKELGTWYHAMQNVWFVNTEFTVSQVRDILKKEIDSNDLLFVCRAEGWASYNMSQQSDWLNGK